jgi:hypothetical protein
LDQSYEVLNRFKEISGDFDKVVETLRSSAADKEVKVRHWIITWLLLPFSTLFDLRGFVKGAKKINVASFAPVIAGTALGPLFSFFTGFSWYILLLIGFIIGYLLSFSIVAPKIMCTFNSGYFRIAAYALFRKQEYELFSKAFLHGDTFYFTPLYEQVALMLSKDNLAEKQLSLIHQRIDTFLNQEKMDLNALVYSLKSELKSAEETYKQALTEYHEEAKNLVKESLELHTGMGYLVDFIKATNIALYRKKNKLFTIADIATMLSCGITIYKKEGSWLNKINDENTSGASRDKYPLNFSHPQFVKDAVVRAALKQDDLEEIDVPYGNRFIVSRKLKMDYGETWYINFHFDDTEQKPLFLTVPNDILNSQEIFRMVHAICLLKQEADILRGVS